MRITLPPLARRVASWFKPGRGAAAGGKRSAGKYIHAVKPSRLKSWHQDTRRNARSNVPFVADGRSLRNLARALSRNRPECSRMVEYLGDKVVGGGFWPSFRTGNEELDALLEARFWLWSRECDVLGDSWEDVLAMAMREIATVGEAFAVMETINGEFRLRMLEPEDLASEFLGTVSSQDEVIIDGVGYRKNGTVSRYFVRQVDVGAAQFSPFSEQVQEVFPQDMIHVLQRWRPNQRRGISPFDSIAVPVADVADADFAQLSLIQVCAMFGLYLRQDPQGDNPVMDGTVSDEDAGGENLPGGGSGESGPGEFVLEPGMMHSGTDHPHVISPPVPSGEYQSYRVSILRGVGARMGVPYSVMVGDFQGLNYSVSRAEETQYRVTWRKWQRKLVARFCHQAIRRWLQNEATQPAVAGMLRGMNLETIVRNVEWIFPKWEWVDPKNEAAALQSERDMGLKTFRQACAERGLDWRDQLAQIKAEREFAASVGLLDVVLPESTAPQPEEPSEVNQDVEA